MSSLYFIFVQVSRFAQLRIIVLTIFKAFKVMIDKGGKERLNH
jgi:hypothetical protein